jgi:hypothetical protein
MSIQMNFVLNIFVYVKNMVTVQNSEVMTRTIQDMDFHTNKIMKTADH